jgi:hypothetical protein
MSHKYRFIVAIITLLVLTIPSTASGSLLSWRPFVVRNDLAPVKMVYKTMRPSASVFEKFTTDNNDPIRAIKGEDEGRERKWSEFQFGSFRLRISRYNDPRLRSDAVQSNKADGIWATMKSIPAQLASSPSRETLETMGKIFTPHLDLAIEF